MSKGRFHRQRYARRTNGSATPSTTKLLADVHRLTVENTQQAPRKAMTSRHDKRK